MIVSASPERLAVILGMRPCGMFCDAALSISPYHFSSLRTLPKNCIFRNNSCFLAEFQPVCFPTVNAVAFFGF